MHGAVNAVLVSRAKLPSLSSGLAEREGITSDWWRAASSARNRFDSFVVPTTCSAMDQRAVLLGPRPPYPTRQRQADGLVAAVRAGSGLGLARRPVRLVLEKPHSIRSTPSRRPGAPAAWRMACRRDAVTSLRQRRIVSSSHPPLQIARGSSGSPSPAHPPRVTSERRGRPASPAGAHAVDLPDAAGRNGAVDPITDACLLHSCRSLVLLLGLPLPGTLLVYVLHSTSPLGSST